MSSRWQSMNGTQRFLAICGITILSPLIVVSVCVMALGTTLFWALHLLGIMEPYE